MKKFATRLKQIQKSSYVPFLLALPIMPPTLLLFAQYSRLWIADMYVSFSPFILVGTALLAIAALVIAHKRIHYIAIMLSVIMLVAAIPSTYNWLFEADMSHAEKGDVRLASFNKLYTNGNYDAFRSKVNPGEYDVVGLSETSDDDYNELKKDWKYSFNANCECDPAQAAELVVLSQYPIIKNEVISAGKRNGGMLRVVIEVEDKELIVYVTHTPSPISSYHFDSRNDMLATLVPSRILRDKNSAAVFMGDLNISPYSHHYKKTERTLAPGYKNVMKGTKIFQTWCLFDVPLACAPIDHMFITNKLTATQPKVINVPGSDHKLITAELVIN